MENCAVMLSWPQWNMQQNRYRASVFRCTVCFCCLDRVATVILAGSSQSVTCRFHFSRLHVHRRVWSFCFWPHLPTCTYGQACKQTQLQILLHAQPFTNIAYSRRPETVACKLQYAQWTCILPDTHSTTHTLKYLYRHTAFLILDALAYTQGDLWGWLPLVLCVSDLILFGFQTSTQHRDWELQWGWR